MRGVLGGGGVGRRESEKEGRKRGRKSPRRRDEGGRQERSSLREGARAAWAGLDLWVKQGTGRQRSEFNGRATVVGTVLKAGGQGGWNGKPVRQ